MKAQKITNLMSKKAQKVKPTDMLICCFCEDEFEAQTGYDYSFCCEECVIEQEELNEREGRTCEHPETELIPIKSSVKFNGDKITFKYKEKCLVCDNISGYETKEMTWNE